MPRLERTRSATLGPVTALALSGRIDETLRQDLLDDVQSPELILDLSGIERINSLGVREWMERVRPVAEQRRVSYVSVSVSIMDQLNMIHGFDCGGELLSFRACYFCEACDEETEATLDALLDRHYFDRLEEPMRQCRVCGQLARLDEDPAVLFEYPRSVATPVPSREVNAFFRSDQSWVPFPPGSRFRLRKEIEGAGTVFRVTGLIDGGFPSRSVVRGAEGRIVLDLSETHGLGDEGVERWNEMMAGLRSEGCEISVVGATPPMLRAFADNPVLIAGATVESVGLPVDREDQQLALVQSSELARFMRSSSGELRGDPSVLRELADRAIRAAGTSPGETKTAQFVRFDPLSYDTPSRATETPGRTTGRHRMPTAQPQKAEPTGPYEILCRLASGGMADVFLARFHGAAGFRRLAVVKQLMRRHVTDSALIRMFLDEARLAARLDHPNVVSILDLGKAGDAYFIAMEYLHGKDAQEVLDQLLARDGTFPIGHALQIIADVLSALDRAHQTDAAGRRLVHSDVKLRNILVSFDGITKLADFGVAQLSRGGETKTGSFRGTLTYAAPECLEGHRPTPAADIWSAGVGLYTLLTGQPPFQSITSEGLIRSILTDDPPPVSSKRPELDSRIDDLIGRALAKDPARRVASAAELEQELRVLAASFGEQSTRRSLAEFLREAYRDQLEAEQRFVREQAEAGLTEALLVAPPEAVSAFFASISDDPTETGSTVHLQGGPG